MLTPPALHSVRRYKIDEMIGSGGMGVVYRAFDRLTGNFVAFKHVRSLEFTLSVAPTATPLDYRRALAQEFKMLASLRHPNIISVLDYGFDDNQTPYFTMELLENPRDIMEASAGKTLNEKLDLLVQTLQALMYLHRRDIIHRDLKPDNVLVIDAQVKVLDFGLAAQRHVLEQEDRENISGTLPYMAPEVLRGEPASKESDLYAVGVMAYEIIAGKYPFAMLNVNDLIEEILHTIPDTSALNLSQRITEVLTRLLAKSPEDRYTDAGEILAIYNEATGRPLGHETRVTRESFLQAARFVGREEEFEHLTAGLNAAMTSNGSGWLIGGESGVGKSRLLDELRTQALVNGAVVLRGQAVPQATIAYTLWRDALRMLCLYVGLSDFEASVMKAIVPDIGVLLGRPVADAPELDPKTTQNRLLGVIEEVFARQKQPSVVVLEDLQWADAESLDLLKRLSDSVRRYPLLIVASYRDDERADLATELPRMHNLRLNRLDAAKIIELSASMLGEVVGRQTQVTELLTRETEGNVFFIVEVVRALAEEAGQLDLVGRRTLPERVFAGGMKAVVQRRLNRVPAEALPLLNVAAVVGRQLDLNVLLAAAPEVDLSAWLAACSNVAVLDVQDGEWRFAHDKLREGVVETLDPTQRRTLHRQVAEALESVYPNDPARAGVLAYHWHEAEDEPQEAKYLARAGEYALTTGAYREARSHLERAVALYERHAVSQVERAHVENLIGRTILTLGQLDVAKPHLEQALALVGYPVPATSGKLTRALLWEFGQQMVNRLLIDTLGRSLTPLPNPEAIKIALRASESLSEINYYRNRSLPTLYHVFQGLNLAERGGASTKAELARFYSSMAGVTAIIPLKKQSRAYTRRADLALENVNDPDAITWVMLSEGTHDNERGDFKESLRRLSYGMQVAEQIGHIRRWQENATQFTVGLRLSGRVQEASELSAQIYASALEQNNLQGQEWALISQAQCAVVLHQYDEALAYLETAEPIHEQTQSESNYIEALGIQVTIQLYRGEIAAAQVTVEHLRSVLGNSAPASYRVTLGFAGVAAYVLLRAQLDEDTELLKWVFRGLKKGAQRFSVAKPRVYAYEAWQARLSGKIDDARRLAQQALTEAQAMEMPFEQALAYYQLAQIDSASDHRMQAESLLRQLGGDYDLTRDMLL